MQKEISISGFGGQGVLFAGQLLAYAAMDKGMNVTWYPSYGPEMRGGTANCMVILSDEEIGAALVGQPAAALVFNLPSLEKFEPKVKPGGLLVIDSSLIEQKASRADIQVVYVPATRIAEELGNRRMANMVMLGALLGNMDVISLEDLEKALNGHLPERHRHLLPANVQAIQAGAACRPEVVS
jgi:2-oxoglutarate ferredoxin oxidoreductase subunit gamma